MIYDLIKDLSKESKIILAGCLGIAVATIPISIAAVLINSGAITYKNQDTEINFSGKAKVKQIANEYEYSTKALNLKIENLQKQLTELNSVSQNNPAELSSKVNEVKRTIEDLKPTADQALKDSQELTKLVDEIEETTN